MVVSHDSKLERISDGRGRVADFTLAELRELNVGIKQGWQVGLCTPEEVFELLSGRLRFNIHLKEHGEGILIKMLVRIAEKYYAKKSIYFAASPTELEYMVRYAPDIRARRYPTTQDTMPIYDMACDLAARACSSGMVCRPAACRENASRTFTATSILPTRPRT